MPDGGHAGTLLRPGENCWRIERAARVAVLVDGEAYFNAFAQAAERARHSIVILAWDFNSRACVRFDPHTGEPLALGAFLNELAAGPRPGRFAACATPQEAAASHDLFTAALESNRTGQAVEVP